MAEYHVGCGAFGIYAGTLNKNKSMWLNKTDVTHEAICAVAQYLVQEDKGLRFDYQGKTYLLSVKPYQAEEDGEKAAKEAKV